MASITSVNAVLIFAVPSVINPVQIQGFSVDDIFGVDPIPVAETLMGVDGKLSAGRINAPIKQGIFLQADSPSNAVFDTWYQQQLLANDVYFANATITLSSVQKKYALTKGVLETYPPISDAGKILKVRKFTVIWESITPATLNSPAILGS
jgi:hypothetical protein